MDNYFRQCKKCGAWMHQIISYNYGNPHIYWKCPNGCSDEGSKSYSSYNTGIPFSKSLRYCKYHSTMCEYATNLGYCQLTVCQYQFLSNYSNCKRYKL